MSTDTLEQSAVTPHTDFTHLHVHTQYSILDGQAGINKLIAKVKEYGMDALAITDHGAMFGAFEFHQQCQKHGIKPIIGFEAYVAVGSRFDKKASENSNSGSHHLILLAKNQEGYHNLCRLCSLGYRDGFYYHPRIDKEILKKYREGLIASSACLGGEIPKLLLTAGEDRAEAAIKEYFDIFGDDFYLELMNHHLPDQAKVNVFLAKISAKYGIKMIATNDTHFVEASDFKAHQILVCLNTGKKYGEQKQMLYTGEEYLKSGDAMRELFLDYPQAIANTREIVDKVEVFAIKRDPLIPKFPLPEGITDEMAYLRELAVTGAKERWGDPLPEVISERLQFELDTVEKMGFPGYFLIVWDFITEARRRGVRVGPGRGSVAGSAIAYAIRITDIDPIKYELLFERFLNPERINMPDMDIDFDDVGREKVVQYVIEKYGADCVAQVVTFGTMAAKSSIKDVARVLDLPLSESERLTKLIPDKKPGNRPDEETLLAYALTTPELSKELSSPNQLIVDTLKYAKELEGSVRNTGTHACAMIIAPENLMNVIPLSTAKDSDMPVVQYEGTMVEDAGLLKMDFLGLSTLTIINNCLLIIKQRHGIDLDIDNIPIDDAPTYELFARGDTTAIFQFESDGMRKYLIDLKPNRFEDLVAMNALYRPGPMDNIPSYIRRKHGKEKIVYDLDDMAQYLEGTYGITVYQEQVMLLSQKLAGFTKGEADTLRKAMGKKDKKKMESWYEKFRTGCKERQHDLTICEKIWKAWKAFANYAFNKSHATCYAYVAYQTAYLKTHYPAEFMAAALTNSINDIQGIEKLAEECKHVQIALLGPDINESQIHFTVNKAGNIRLGLAALKGVGSNAVEGLIQEREQHGLYQDIFDFVQRVDLRKLNKKCFESLAQAGSFDCFKGLHRSSFFYQKPGEENNFINILLNFANQLQKNKDSEQISLFGDTPNEDVIEIPKIPVCEPWSKFETLQKEKEITGFYISGHPLNDYNLEQQYFTNITLGDLKNNLAKYKDQTVRFIGMIVDVKHLLTKKDNSPYGRFSIQDFEESMEFTVFSKEYAPLRNYLILNTFVIIHASVGLRWQSATEYQVRINKIEFLDNFMNDHTQSIDIRVDTDIIIDTFVKTMQNLAQQYKGKSSLNFEIIDRSYNTSLMLPSRTVHVLAKPFMEQCSVLFPQVTYHLKTRS
ncbi:DNA-directed DNA polymerase [Bacteroidia bacterium]|nr:DNA-directed DNA polymerase [Bacteroidia bacterium]